MNMEGIVWRAIWAILGVWVVLSIFLPFVYGYVAFPDILKTLIALGVVIAAIIYVIKGSFSLK